MIKVGITGGIASGKSTICKLFSILEIPVYISDIRAHQLMMTDLEVIHSLRKTFGTDIYHSNGMVNKEKMAKLVFESPETRNRINAIVHPAVRLDFDLWCERYKNATAYVIQESAILFETGLWKNLDLIITVTCPINERIERIQLRDTCSVIEAQKKIKSQMDDKEKIEKSTFVIESSIKNLVIKKVLDIHKKILQHEN